MPQISIIVAMSENRVIGINNQLPWHISEDLKRFKSITMGKPIVMGRKTWLSIGRPLPGRDNVVLTRNKQFRAAGCSIYHSFEDVVDHYQTEEEIMIIGGKAIYTIALPITQKLYITQIHRCFEGDTFFPALPNCWQEIYRDNHKSKDDAPAFSFLEMVRKPRHD